ncbi:MAG: signal peptidase I [bacterium]|nr:signal peptidase I [bacterium]
MIHKISQHPVTKHAINILGIKLKILLFVVLPLVILTLLTSQTDLIRGYKSFVVVSGSMEPTVPVGSIVYSQKSGGYQKGDVISFKNSKGQTVTHRIISVVKESPKQEIPSKETPILYKTKGDANNTADTASVLSGDVLGKVFFQVPYVGRVIGFIKTPVGFGLLIILPAALFILSELWNIKKEIEKEVEKRVLSRVQNSTE